MQPMGPKTASRVADRLMGFYPQSPASDPQIFMTGMVELLAAYPVAIIENLCSVISGIPAKYKFLPSIAELKEECERFAQPHREAEYLEQRKAQPREMAIAPPREARESIDDLRKRHGDNWGINDPEAKRRSKWLDLGQIAAKYGVDPKVAQALPDLPIERAR